MVYRLKSSPLLLPTLFWCLGIVAAQWVSNSLFSYLVLAATAFLLGGLLVPKARFHFTLLLFLCLGMMRMSLSIGSSEPLKDAFAHQARLFQRIEFEVISPLGTDTGSYDVRIRKLAGVPQKLRAILSSKKPLQSGRSYSGNAELFALNRDPELDFGSRKYQARAVIGFASQDLGEVKGNVLLKWRSRIIQSLDKRLGDHSGLAKTLLVSDNLGKREWGSVLSAAGLSHLVVVSGMHVVFIYFLLITSLQILVSKRGAEILAMGIICIFAGLNLWSASVLRATLMIGIFIFGRWISRPVVKSQLLALTLFIISMADPFQLFNIGLQLSFLCVALIFFALPKLRFFDDKLLAKRFWLKPFNSALQYMLVSFVVSIGTFPLLALYFGSPSLNGVIGNLLGIPLMGIILPLSALVLTLPLNSYLLELTITSYKWLYELFFGWAEWSALLPLRFEDLPRNNAMIIIYTGIAIAILLIINRKLRNLLPVMLATLLLYLGFWGVGKWEQRRTLRIYLFAAGVADCSLVLCPDGKSLMIDSGAAYDARLAVRDLGDYSSHIRDNSWLKQKLLPWLRRRAINKIDYLVLTHMHKDHFGGVPSLLQNVEVQNIFVSDETYHHHLWQKWMQQGLLTNSDIFIVSDTLSWALGGMRLKFLHPDKDYRTLNENNRSLVLSLSFEGVRYLFTGDIEKDAESYLLNRYEEDLKADYLKVPHHGSRGSSSEEFIRIVNPREAWISSSLYNKHKLPHPDAVSRFSQQGIRLRNTSEGTILHKQRVRKRD